MRASGFDSAPIGIVDAAIHWYQGDQAGADAILEEMSARGWRVFGLMRFSPLYDELLASETEGASGRLQSAFEPIEQNCAAIALSKLGL